jgi:hypothetical protein
MEALPSMRVGSPPYGGELFDEEIRVHAPTLGRAIRSPCPGNDTTAMTTVASHETATGG